MAVLSMHSADGGKTGLQSAHRMSLGRVRQEEGNRSGQGWEREEALGLAPTFEVLPPGPVGPESVLGVGIPAVGGSSFQKLRKGERAGKSFLLECFGVVHEQVYLQIPI